MSLEQVMKYRRDKDVYFKSSLESPLTPDQRQIFEGLAYYEYNPDMALHIQIERINPPEMAQIFTTKDGIRNYGRFGFFSFVVDEQTVTLTIYQSPHGFFLPFVDDNPETYPAGRYLEPLRADDDEFFVDFNLAYNPFCAYNDRWECPITPVENRLPVAIRAGEKLPPAALMI